MKKCPYCAEQIQDEAIFCRYCGKDTRVPVPPPGGAPSRSMPEAGAGRALGHPSRPTRRTYGEVTAGALPEWRAAQSYEFLREVRGAGRKYSTWREKIQGLERALEVARLRLTHVEPHPSRLDEFYLSMLADRLPWYAADFAGSKKARDLDSWLAAVVGGPVALMLQRLAGGPSGFMEWLADLAKDEPWTFCALEIAASYGTEPEDLPGRIKLLEDALARLRRKGPRRTS